MKVLHLITGRGPTGPAAAAMLDVKSLQSAGHTAHIASRSGSGLQEACDAEAIPYIGGVKLGRGALRLLDLPGDVRRLRAILREYAIDVLHVHRSDDQMLAGLAIGRRSTVTLVRTWHRNPRGIPRPLLSKLATHVDACVCVSRDDVVTLKAAGTPQCEFIPTAVDTAIFHPAQLEKAPRGREAPGCTIAHVGRWKRERDGRDRGQRAALEVFQQLNSGLPWRGLLVGRGEMADELRREAYEERKLSRQRVELLHFPKQAPGEFAALLSSFDLGLVFVPGSDGSSRAAVELLACGVPLLVADLPGLRELAEDQECAVRLLPNDPRGWAAAIERLILQPDRLEAMSAAARKRAETIHSLKARGDALAALYRS